MFLFNSSQKSNQSKSHPKPAKSVVTQKNFSQLERKVMFQKATEPPFQNQFDGHFEAGVYVCKNCHHLLYLSQNKFQAYCGWPAFDAEAQEAVRREPDRDGRRTEILCQNCGVHLGHVFVGEGITPKNTRHCVNSASLDFLAEKEIQKINLAAGCFWGVEHLFKKLPGVIYTEVGYTGGETQNPNYQEVCRGCTGHLEVVRVWYDRQLISDRGILQYFFEIHDFEQTDGQGPDLGKQYLSAIFYPDTKIQDLAGDILKTLISMGYRPATQILPEKTFYRAEKYHQNYYQKTGKSPYCHTHTKIF